MKNISKVLFGLIGFCLIGQTPVNGNTPVNASYDANLSILPQRLNQVDTTQDVDLNTVLATLDKLLPQNLNNEFNSGNDLFNLASQQDENGQKFTIPNFNREKQLITLIDNIKHICKTDKDNENVLKIINARATQLLDTLATMPLGTDANNNFAKISHELRGLQLTHADVDAYLNPQPEPADIGSHQ